MNPINDVRVDDADSFLMQAISGELPNLFIDDRGTPYPQLEADIQALRSAGFSVANLSSYDKIKDGSVDASTGLDYPDIALVSNGGVEGALLEHAMIFVSSGMDEVNELQIHLALDENTPKQTVDDLFDESNAFFIPKNRDETGPLVGYLTIRRENGSFDNALANIKALGLNTVKFPCSNRCLDLLVPFRAALEMPKEEEVGRILGHHLQGHLSVLVDMPEKVKAEALRQVYGYTERLDEPGDASARLSNAMKPKR
jgi:hypothetical protein